MRSRLIRLRGASPFENLAMEECLFAHLPPSSHRLLFYTHRPAIVIGRTQNPFYEASVPHARESATPILRRRSGGGTVVHDEHNLNLSFMGPYAHHDPPRNVQVIMRALASAPIAVPAHALATGARGDVTVRGKKISGSAYRLSKGSAYHHATLLVDSDLRELRACLASEIREGLVVSGAESVRSSVTNIVDELPAHASLQASASPIESVVEAVAKSYCDTHGIQDMAVEDMGVEDLEREVGGGVVREEVHAMSQRDWVYGQTPRFSFTCEVDGDKNDGAVVLFVRKGAIVEHVQLISGGDRSGVVVGPARGRGSLGTDDGHLNHSELTRLLSGSSFCGTSLRGRAADAEDPTLKELILRIAERVPCSLALGRGEQLPAARL